VRLAGQKARREWSFALAPDPGNFWLGLDPGTSGACIAGGSNPDDLELVPLRHGQAEEERCVAPSLVYVCTGLREDETALPFSVDGQEIRYLAGDKAAARATLSDAPSRLFRSAKRLIGYGNPFSVLFEGSAVKMRGQDAVAMLADFLVDQASNYFQQQQPQREPIRINKLVLAVPNMFTPGKKEHMRRCCQVRGVQRVLTIYEAEAVLVYYWWHTAKLHPQPIRPERLRSQLGEHVLIMDFGGGGVNFTYAVIEEKEEDSDRILSGSNSGRLQTKSGMDAEQRAEKQVRTRIHTLQRLGFAIGGDHLDWEIARLLWEGIRHTGEPDPYIPPAGVHPGRMRNLLLNTAAKVKVHSCQSWADKRPTEAYAFPQSEFREWKGQLLSAESLLADTGIQARLAELESGIEELRNLCGAEDWRVDTIIFSGRSTRFPALKEQIARKVQSLDPTHEAQIVPLHGEEKTCVARGAALWGMQQSRVHLLSDRTFAHYGVVRRQPSGAVFDSLISAGTPFRNGSCEGGLEFPRTRYPYNSNELVLLQVMGSSPERAVRDSAGYTRRSVLAAVRFSSDSRIDRVSLRLEKDDRFHFNVEQGTESNAATADFLVDDIRKEGDPSAEWLLDMPAAVAAAR